MNSLTNGNGDLRPSRLAGRAVARVLRRPALALLRRYADWVEHSSTMEVEGPGASYAGRAVYVCTPENVPVIFLHRAHYDDRTLLRRGGGVNDALALFAHAAGLLVSRGDEPPPEIERSVRAGNAALFVVDTGDAGRANARIAADLALRTAAPIIALRAEARLRLAVPFNGLRMHWPAPRNKFSVVYGALEHLEGGPDDGAARIHELLDAH